MIEIKKTVTEVAMTSDGKVLNKGDMILIKIDDQFVVTKFVTLFRGYVVTENMDGEKVQYRKGSIETCRKIKPIQFIEEEQ